MKKILMITMLALRRIDHYEQRMSVLFFKKRFSERVGECRPKVEGQ